MLWESQSLYQLVFLNYKDNPNHNSKNSTGSFTEEKVWKSLLSTSIPYS